MVSSIFTAQKINFSIKDFFSKYDQIRRKLRIWSHLLKNVFTEGINKMTLSSNYDEKIQSINSIERYAHVISKDEIKYENKIKQ